LKQAVSKKNSFDKSTLSLPAYIKQLTLKTVFFFLDLKVISFSFKVQVELIKNDEIVAIVAILTKNDFSGRNKRLKVFITQENQIDINKFSQSHINSNN
jgi:hypothetical protein